MVVACELEGLLGGVVTCELDALPEEVAWELEGLTGALVPCDDDALFVLGALELGAVCELEGLLEAVVA